MRTERRPWVLRALGRSLLVALALLGFQCASTREDPTGGETHFLKKCDDDASACGPDLSCICGLCTLPCAASSACERFPAADCVSPPHSDSCSPQSAGICDVTCTAAEDCAWLSPSHLCADGVCRSDVAPAPTCSNPAVAANEVVVLGDSFFAASHRITAFLEDLARQSGALAAGERYRDASRLTNNALDLTGRGLEDQYATASSESAVTVVIMTGGGADLLLGSCDTITSDCELFVAATDAARALFQRMAAGGVEQLIYVFYPDPTDSELREKVDTLRPLLQSACDVSPVPCHWVDLRESFAGNQDTYLDATGTSPTPEGANAAARQIWGVMQDECIAQAP